MHNDSLWFTNVRMNVRLSNRDNATGLSIIENVMAHGFSPPLHTHHDEAETFYILDGTVRFQLNDKTTIATAGDVVHAPAGSVHSFVILSPNGARFLTITNGRFEDMVREVSRAPTNDGLPPQVVPSLEEQHALGAAGMRNGIELLGAPLAA